MKVFRIAAPASPEQIAAIAGALASYAGIVTVLAEPASPPITPARIVAWVSIETMISVAEIESGRHHAPTRRARAVAAWGMYVLLDATFEPIGDWLGGATAGGGRGLVTFAERLRARDARFRQLTDRLIDFFVEGETA